LNQYVLAAEVALGGGDSIEEWLADTEPLMWKQPAGFAWLEGQAGIFRGVDGLATATTPRCDVRLRQSTGTLMAPAESEQVRHGYTVCYSETRAQVAAMLDAAQNSVRLQVEPVGLRDESVLRMFLT
jgi:hypothetical protein